MPYGQFVGFQTCKAIEFQVHRFGRQIDGTKERSFAVDDETVFFCNGTLSSGSCSFFTGFTFAHALPYDVTEENLLFFIGHVVLVITPRPIIFSAFQGYRCTVDLVVFVQRITNDGRIVQGIHDRLGLDVYRATIGNDHGIRRFDEGHFGHFEQVGFEVVRSPFSPEAQGILIGMYRSKGSQFGRVRFETNHRIVHFPDEFVHRRHVLIQRQFGFQVFVKRLEATQLFVKIHITA